VPDAPDAPGGIAVDGGYRSLQEAPGGVLLDPWVQRAPAHPDLPDGRDYGIRLSLADVKGISDAEIERIVAGQPYVTLADFWRRAHVSRPVVERLVMAGGFDSLYGLGGAQGPTSATGLGRRGRVTRRDLLLHVVELDRWSRSVTRSGRRLAPRTSRADAASAARASSLSRSAGTGHQDVRALAAASSQGAAPVVPARDQSTQLTLDLGDTPELTAATGLPEMTGPERVRAELDILGLDASAHIIDFYAPMLVALGVTRSGQMLGQRNRADLLVAGVKVATQTPPIRSGRRVVFLTLDDSTGPVDATFFEDVQGPYAATVFHSWMLLVRGVLRRTGPRGVSLRATGAWELSALWEAWTRGGVDAVHAALAAADERAHVLAEAGAAYGENAVAGAAQSRSSRPVMAPAAAMGLPGGSAPPTAPDENGGAQAGGMGGARRRVLVHASGFKQSPYADIKPAGGDVKDSRKLPGEGHAVPDPARPGPPPVTAPRKLWHASPGSSGH
jgi:error-prone DNA polymerase